MPKKTREEIIWQPFNSLTPLIEVKQDLNKNKSKIAKPILSPDQIKEIEEKILDSYYSKEEVLITYYRGGYLYKISVYIKYIDKLKKQLVLSNGSIIYFKQIIDIS